MARTLVCSLGHALVVAVAIGVVELPSASAQSTDASRPEFEVASVKRSVPPQNGAGVRDDVRGGPGTADPNLITYSNLRLKDLLTTAYGVKSYQVLGPDWIDSERYDIVARIPAGTSREQFPVMLRNLLTERFRMTVLREKRELPVFELVVAKNGPKLKPWVHEPGASADPSPGQPPRTGQDGFPIPAPGQIAIIGGNGRVRIAATRAGVAKLADRLSGRLDRPVVDKTGLTGEYDYRLEFSADALAGTADQDVRDLFTAVQDQLGLKLESGKSLVDVVVIEKAEKLPAEN